MQLNPLLLLYKNLIFILVYVDILLQLYWMVQKYNTGIALKKAFYQKHLVTQSLEVISCQIWRDSATDERVQEALVYCFFNASYFFSSTGCSVFYVLLC